MLGLLLEAGKCAHGEKKLGLEGTLSVCPLWQINEDNNYNNKLCSRGFEKISS